MPLAPAAVRWAIPLGGAGRASGRGVAIGADGRVVIAGSYSGRLRAGPARLRSAGGDDAFAVVLSPDGDVRWARGLGGPGEDAALAVAVDPHGDVAIAGAFAGRVAVGGRSIAATGSSDGFVAVFGPGGALRWIRAAHSTEYSAFEAVAFTDDGGVVAGGYFAGSVTVAGASLTSAGDQDMLLVGYGAGGTPRWTRRGGGRGPDFVHGVTAAGRGRVAIAGSISRRGALGETTVHARGSAAVVALLGADGTPAWVRQLGESGHNQAYAVARIPGAPARLAVTGTFTGSLAVGDHALEAAGASDVFVAVLAADGKPVWARRIGGAGADLAGGVAATAGLIVATGSFEGTAVAAGKKLEGAGHSDLYAAAYTPDGAPRWARHFGSAGEDAAGGVAARGKHIVLTGTVAGDSRFGDRALPHRGDADAVAAMLTR